MGRLIRSVIFDVLFYLYTFIVMAIFLPVIFLPQGGFWAGYFWAKGTLALLKSVVGLSYHVEGIENLPKGPFIIASKHESAWDTVIFHRLLNCPSYALKRELTFIPLFNLYLWRMKMVTIDRSAGASALKSLLQGTRRVMAEGRPLVIYPEGTRAIPGKLPKYQAGVGVIYRDLGVPVVPVALNSGRFWGRRRIKQPGEITIKFLPPIQPGLTRADFMEKMVDSIEAACSKLNASI